MNLRAPSGTPPPAGAEFAGKRLDLVALASEICDRYHHEFDDEHDRYGDAGAEWCRHDNRWLLAWAVDDALGATDLGEQVAWLTRVLHGRGFPVERLARDLEIAADVITERLGEGGAPVSERLRTAAASVSVPES
ncbi:MAG: hypothetical protein HY827_07230 [Actinobacteria bacterium]|nr:hypothetical protein [Actinomycetota bacterium]